MPNEVAVNIAGVAADAADAARPPTVQYGRFLKWGWRILAWGTWRFPLCLFLNFIVAQLFPLSMKAMETLTTVLNNAEVKGPLAFLFAGTNGQRDSIVIAAAIFAATGAATILCRLAVSITDTCLTPILEGTLQSTLHDRVLALGPDFHKKHPTGECITIMTNYSNYTVTMVKDLFTKPIVEGTGLATSFYFIVDSLGRTHIQPANRALLYLLLLLLPVVGYLLSKALRRAYARLREREFALKNDLLNTLGNPLETQLINATAERSRSYKKSLADYYRQWLHAQFMNLINFNVQSAAALGAQILFVLLAVVSGLGGNSADLLYLGSSLVVFITLIPRVFEPIQSLISFYIAVQTAWISIHPVLDLLEAKPEVEDAPDALPLRCGNAPSIVFDRVVFGHHPGRLPLLAGASHQFAAGKTTAILGSSGSGKTTVFHLISRIFDPWSGSVRVDGHDLRTVTLGSLRAAVVTVSQSPLFIEDSVRRNFQLVKPDASDREISEICRRTGIWETLRRVSPDGELDYVIPRNGGLSSGQKRRLALARGLMQKPKALLLDEPTTGLGIDGIAEVLEALALIREEWPDTTILIIDHSISFINDFADEAVSLADGGFVSHDNQAELLIHPRYPSPRKTDSEAIIG